MVLLDTHVWWWCLSEPSLLSKTAAQLIDSTSRREICVAAISLWEVAVLFHKQRLQLSTTPEIWMDRALAETGFTLVPLSPAIALAAYQLPGEFHSDPADRLIVATARNLNATLLTKDQKILDYDHVRAVWQ